MVAPPIADCTAAAQDPDIPGVTTATQFPPAATASGAGVVPVLRSSLQIPTATGSGAANVPALALQGAVAHCDMPVDSGPTMLLPFSQRFAGGYLAFHRPEFIDYFAQHQVQVPLATGDAVFFNPALYHGAGANVSGDIRRIANLLQISSPFGRAMEAVDRTAMVFKDGVPQKKMIGARGKHHLLDELSDYL